MGGERKSKEKSRKRVSPSQSEDGGHTKRHRRTSDDYGEGSSKRDKKETSHPKSSKRHSKKEKSERKHKRERSKHNQHSRAEYTELTNDDYYSKNNEFATWLKEERKKFFFDLSSNSARELFVEFVDDWNSKKLKSKYYEGIATGPRSSHNWKIRN